MAKSKITLVVALDAIGSDVRLDPSGWRLGATLLADALGKDTKKANAKTKLWLDEEITRQDAQRASGDAVYMIRDQHWYGGYETDEAHADARADGTVDRCGVERHQRFGAWWTRHEGRKFGIRRSWSDALARLREIRKAGGHETMIVHVPRTSKAQKEAA